MRILFINMPFASVYKPSIGIGLLQAAIKERGTECDSLYLNLDFAAMIGQESYDQLSENSTYATNSLAGEWIFTQSLFGIENFEEYRDYYASTFQRNRSKTDSQDDAFSRLLEIRNNVETFLAHAVQDHDWSKYDIIGFTSVFQQNVAALSLAKRLKAIYPEKIIVFGGANMEGQMGLGTLQSYDFVDIICSGEGDHSFVEFIEQLKSKRDITQCSVPGITLHSKFGIPLPTEPVSGIPVHDMNTLPYPDYDEYFQQFEQAHLEAMTGKQSFLFESSRGCWWGQKSHCLFCGLNGSNMNYRSKTAERALEEILYMKERYQPYTNKATAVDNIIDMSYFKSLLPEIRDRDLDLDMFYETKANLTKEQIKLFRDAGFHFVQPGIESIITSVLKRMKKGVSMLQNIRLLKWCAEFSVIPAWNFLYGFPGENEDEYDDAAYLMPSLTHLMPPGGFAPIRLDRFSPYFDSPLEYGIQNILPLRSYELIYPSLSPQERLNIAYHFDFDYSNGQDPSSYTADVQASVDTWKRDYRQSEFFSVLKDERLILVDTRMVAAHPTTLLSALETAIYQECDNMISSANVVIRLKEQGLNASEEQVLQCLTSFVNRHWMLTEGGVFLSLAIPLGDYSPKKEGLERLRDINISLESQEIRASSLS